MSRGTVYLTSLSPRKKGVIGHEEAQETKEIDRVVMYSGGLGSWAAAKRVAALYGVERLTLLFTDTLIEDPDLYRFLEESVPKIGGRLVRLSEGRTIWEIFRDERFLGNSRVDPCSKILKREMADRWLRENCDPVRTVVYVGIDWSESHRFDRLAKRKLPWVYEAPLCGPPYVTRRSILADLAEDGIEPPRLYALGFAHNNCGGGCVKAGMGHFAHLHKQLPEVFSEWERQEDILRNRLGDVAILRDRSGGKSRPMSLSELRARIEGNGEIDRFEIGGCGCFSDVQE